MATQHSVKQVLATRVARRKDLKAYPKSFVDTVIPRYERNLYSIIGKSVFEDPAMKPAITIPHPFSFSLIEVPAGNGAGLHSHTTEEVFMPVDGKLAVFWGDKGENEIVLGPLDTVTVPIGAMRGFRNVDKKTIQVLAIVGGDDGGRLTWHPKLVDEAAEHGGKLDNSGHLKVAKAKPKVKAAAAKPKTKAAAKKR
jgi:mannose-6-phosphate isomerase-like protein (cupin superfamily)